MQKNNNLNPRKHALQELHEIRWVERHKVILTFVEKLPALPAILEAIASLPKE